MEQSRVSICKRFATTNDDRESSQRSHSSVDTEQKTQWSEGDQSVI